MIFDALQFAKEAHGSINQKRKTGEDYIIHPYGVVELLHEITDDENILAAGAVHDIFEDVYPVNSYYSPELVEKLFGKLVLKYAKEVTNLYTKTLFPEFNRKERKRLENIRISKISPEGKTIKLADIIDNCSNLSGLGDFAEVYKKEKQEQLRILTDGDSSLWYTAHKILFN